MKITIKRVFTAALLSTIAGSASSFELSPEAVKGVYSLAQPERSTARMTDKLSLEYGEYNGDMVLVAASCSRCPPAVYRLMATEAKELGRPIFFNASGLYVVAYDSNTFVTVLPDGQLGRQVWKNLAYANVYSKQGTATISLDAAQ
jgi:hypothetical protein